ncbi:hypothetical protein G3M81_05610 [Bacillus paralicheniformis]|uniref:hypothetical protein n=1 Tax=Bacillus paralicheniformis TaxID=1648923 RepID=UPI0013EF1CA4|nr:hypothetical protein [Bacillus paralicheniformis]QII48233.1 hypothetical protein G3M81_05610 [Bacillus paralicheniformis]
MNQTGKRMTDMQAHLYICRAIFSGECVLRDQSALFYTFNWKNTSERHLPTIGFSDADGGV